MIVEYPKGYTSGYSQGKKLSQPGISKPNHVFTTKKEAPPMHSMPPGSTT